MIAGRAFLASAAALQNGPAEADWRSAVSRAYYAAFHEARMLFHSLGFRVPRAEQAHAYLWLRLSNCGDPQVRQAGTQLNHLRGQRNVADYDLALTVTQRDASVHVQSALRIVRILDAASAEPTRTRITDAMKVYERDVLKQVTWTP